MSEFCDVLIVGGGPAGVAAALALRKAGVARVTLLERETYLGGATRHCAHSPFGMREFGRVYFGAAYGKRLEREIAAAGVDLRLSHSVTHLGEDGTIDFAAPSGSGRIGARRVVLATGNRETSRAAHLTGGDRPVGVLTTGALQQYAAFHGKMPFRAPVIIGTELVSQSAVLTCLSHGARPVAMLESGPEPRARAPFRWLPRLRGVPVYCDAHLVDIRGSGRVEEVTFETGGTLHRLACDGVLFTGRFTPEASLARLSDLPLAAGSQGPAVDQYGRTENPVYFAAGNLLRGVETAGWSFREGAAVGAAVAADLTAGQTAAPIRLHHDAPIKLVVPSVLRSGSALPAALSALQLRVTTRSFGRLVLCTASRELWSAFGDWLPERRILIPLPSVLPQEDLYLRIEEHRR